MIFASQRPGPPLDSFVDHFWFYSGLVADHERERVLPSGTMELIFNLRDRPRRLFPHDRPDRPVDFRRAWMSGPQSGYIVIDVLRDSSLMGVRFRPGGAAAFLGLPADQLRDRVVELEDLWGAEAGTLWESLREAPTAAAKFRLLERHLLRRSGPAPGDDPVVSHALRRFRETPHLTRIEGLAAEVGLSHKQFIRRFRSRVGLGPKRYCRILRFREVLERVEREESVVWADLAAACGYYDQAHFIAEFRGFSGLNPTRYLRERGDDLGFVPLSDPGR
jgi:methylphosphotriester-DNA--protein-cysteine methyltransferase